MALSQQRAVEQTRILLNYREQEKTRLEKIHSYLRGKQGMPWLTSDAPREVRQLARVSRVNVLRFVVESHVQSMYVDGFRAPKEADDQPAWELWQRNRMDARQSGVHRATSSYGASYVTVLPGDPVPVLRGVSPRSMTVVYGGDDDWPMWALEKRRTASADKLLFRLFDSEATYWMSCKEGDPASVEYISHEEHGVGVVPVVRFLDAHDLDDEVVGEVEPLYDLQDQINITTFALQVAQHYGAFRQRYIIGWLADTEEEKLKASAAKLWTFEDHPDEIKIGEFEQTDVKGYIESREATLRHLATVSQTPVHELLGQLVNLSAEALVAARDAADRKLTNKQVSAGESWEQSLSLGGTLAGFDTDPSAWVRWRDTQARSLAQTADALGKLVQMLGVPPQELWERVPGISQQEVERWKAAAAEGDAFGNLAAMLDRQAAEI